MTGCVGLLGGSFNPVHRAHIALAQAACEALSLDYVELIPAAHPWQRGDLGASPEQRLQMLQLACTTDPRLRVNPIEIQRAGTTYTIDTLLALPAGPHYLWILGADQLANFCTWHRWRDIVRLVTLAVAQRPGASTQAPDALAAVLPEGSLLHIPFAPQDVSATAIRQALAQGQDVSALLDPGVLDYIRAHQLYAHNAPSD